MVCFLYSDDIFCVYVDLKSGGMFLVWLNAVHPTIKFTVSGRQEGVNVLWPLRASSWIMTVADSGCL